MNRLSDSINTTSYTNDERTVNNWNNVIGIFISKYITRTIDVSPVVADKYRFDLYGLFSNELNIPEEHIYPHILANGYMCSNEYDSKKLRFVLLDTTMLNNYSKLFKK